MKKYILCAALILACAAPAAAQTVAPTPPVSIVFAVLTKPLESKSASAGQELTLRTISDVTVEGAVVIPKGSRLLGRVTEVRVKGAGVAQSALSVVIEKALTPDGAELPLQAIIAAVAAPMDKSPDPTYGMLHSAEPKMVATSPGRTSVAGELPAGSRGGGTSEVAAADLQAGASEPLLLKADSQGAVGYEGLSLFWQLTEPPPTTVFSTKGKNVKLDAGTQMLLRMAPPRPARRKP